MELLQVFETLGRTVYYDFSWQMNPEEIYFQVTLQNSDSRDDQEYLNQAISGPDYWVFILECSQVEDAIFSQAHPDHNPDSNHTPVVFLRTSPVRVAGGVDHEKSLLFTQTGNIHGTSIAGLIWLGLQAELVMILGKISAIHTNWQRGQAVSCFTFSTTPINLCT